MRPALFAAALAASALLVADRAAAQYVYVTGYAPAPVVVAPTVAYRPVVPVVAYSPVVAAPVVAAPAPVAVTHAVVPTPVVTTRYRPILGGTVSRVRYRYAPTTVVTPLY